MYMPRSRLAALALAACALAGHFVTVAVFQPIAAVCRLVGFHVKEACALASPKLDLWPGRVMRAKVQAFAAAMVKRERPVLSPTWRMCPST